MLLRMNLTYDKTSPMLNAEPVSSVKMTNRRATNIAVFELELEQAPLRIFCLLVIMGMVLLILGLLLLV